MDAFWRYYDSLSLDYSDWNWESEWDTFADSAENGDGDRKTNGTKPQPTKKEVIQAYEKLYIQWTLMQIALGTDFRYQGILTNAWRLFSIDSVDCTDFAADLAKYLTDRNPFPGIARARSISTGLIWGKGTGHHRVGLFMDGPDGETQIEWFDPWWGSSWKGFVNSWKK
jgi:hypothetical protein